MMGPSTKLLSAVEAYFADLSRVRASGGGTGGRSHYPALSNLLGAVGQVLKPKVFCGHALDRDQLSVRDCGEGCEAAVDGLVARGSVGPLGHQGDGAGAAVALGTTLLGAYPAAEAQVLEEGAGRGGVGDRLGDAVDG